MVDQLYDARSTEELQNNMFLFQDNFLKLITLYIKRLNNKEPIVDEETEKAICDYKTINKALKATLMSYALYRK